MKRKLSEYWQRRTLRKAELRRLESIALDSGDYSKAADLLLEQLRMEGGDHLKAVAWGNWHPNLAMMGVRRISNA